MNEKKASGKMSTSGEIKHLFNYKKKNKNKKKKFILSSEIVILEGYIP